MLKRIRQAGEAVGVLAPSLADATAAAEQRRAALIEAQARIASAERELEAAYDRGATPKEISEAEAALADSKITADRAQKSYSAAERRLASAREAEGVEFKAEAINLRDAALEIQRGAAAEIDRLAGLIAEQVVLYDAQFNALSEAASKGVAARIFRSAGSDIVKHALERAGALPSSWIGSRDGQPGAAELAAKAADAVTAGV
jgi:hypothetical protein